MGQTFLPSGVEEKEKDDEEKEKRKEGRKVSLVMVGGLPPYTARQYLANHQRWLQGAHTINFNFGDISTIYQT